MVPPTSETRDRAGGARAQRLDRIAARLEQRRGHATRRSTRSLPAGSWSNVSTRTPRRLELGVGVQRPLAHVDAGAADGVPVGRCRRRSAPRRACRRPATRRPGRSAATATRLRADGARPGSGRHRCGARARGRAEGADAAEAVAAGGDRARGDVFAARRASADRRRRSSRSSGERARSLRRSPRVQPISPARSVAPMRASESARS